MQQLDLFEYGAAQKKAAAEKRKRKEVVYRWVVQEISRRIWDSRLDKLEVAHECWIYLVTKTKVFEKPYVTKKYITYHISNFLSRELRNGTGEKLLSIFHTRDEKGKRKIFSFEEKAFPCQGRLRGDKDARTGDFLCKK